MYIYDIHFATVTTIDSKTRKKRGQQEKIVNDFAFFSVLYAFAFKTNEKA